MGKLAQLPIVSFRSCRSQASLFARMEAHGAPALVVFESDQNQTVHGAVAAGLGVAVMLRLAVDEQRDDITLNGGDRGSIARRRIVSGRCSGRPLARDQAGGSSRFS